MASPVHVKFLDICRYMHWGLASMTIKDLKIISLFQWPFFNDLIVWRRCYLIAQFHFKKIHSTTCYLTFSYCRATLCRRTWRRRFLINSIFKVIKAIFYEVHVKLQDHPLLIEWAVSQPNANQVNRKWNNFTTKLFFFCGNFACVCEPIYLAGFM